jgi:Xaa-Pro dipeptidase
MQKELTRLELENRVKRLCFQIGKKYSDWDTVLILGRVNQYYFTGTMQDGLLVIKKDGTLMYFARRSYSRAKTESPMPECVYPMESYRDVAGVMGGKLGNTLIETELVTIDVIERLKKYFTFDKIYPAKNIIFDVRSIKSTYELDCIRQAGLQHKYLLEDAVPGMLREGMSEVDFTAELFEKMLKMGHQGVARFNSYQTEMIVGQIAFGENSLYPTNFDGPGGMKGISPAVPLFGSRERLLKKGDMVFIDIGYCIEGYHSDKTQVYMFGATPSDEIVRVHRQCIEVEKRTAEMLKPGIIPSQIYDSIISGLDAEFLNNFMGFGERRAKFLGHGVGLHVDEYPVIATGFNDPIEENMVFALEPKKGIAGVGMVGVEDTYIVTPGGGSCVTGGERDIIVV